MHGDYAEERRRVIGWYADPRWTAYCGVCGVRLGTCGCGSTPAGATPPPVSLPNNVEASAAPVEETQADYWTVCPKCKLVLAYCTCS